MVHIVSLQNQQNQYNQRGLLWNDGEHGSHSQSSRQEQHAINCRQNDKNGPSGWYSKWYDIENGQYHQHGLHGQHGPISQFDS